MFISIVLFIIGLVLLIFCGDWFVDGATGIARKFHIPELIIGATIVSIGTTLPEVMVSADAAIKGQGATAYGNAIGSIICNTALILAITIAVKPSKVDKKSLKTPVIFFFVAALIYVLNAYIFKRFSLASGIVLLSVFVIYMIYTVITTKKRMAQEVKTTEPVEENQNEEEEEEKEKKEKAPKKSWFDGLKAEFGKIIWPDQKSIGKQTAAVLSVSVVLGVLITIIDMIVQYGVDFLVK